MKWDGALVCSGAGNNLMWLKRKVIQYMIGREPVMQDLVNLFYPKGNEEAKQRCKVTLV